MSRTLYLLRHGQTRYNAELRLQGRCNSDLTARGEAQALAMGARLAELLAEPASWILYASPLGRARQTAERVCQQLGLDKERIVWDERLVELGSTHLLPITGADALLIADGTRTQDVKVIAQELNRQGHDAYRLHRTVTRPWGTYTVLEEGAE